VTNRPYDDAAAEIDRINATDPKGEALARSQRVEDWVRTLDQSASDIQLLAARAHHLGRWKYPRSDFPEGRSGYLRWRRDAAKRQAQELEVVLQAAGFSSEEAAQAGAIVTKQDLRTSAAVQVHEDALCLSFLENDLEDFIDEHGDDKAVRVLARTMAKMSVHGLDVAGTLELSDRGAELVTRAAGVVEESGPGSPGGRNTGRSE
jgi:hypothetical protein